MTATVTTEFRAEAGSVLQAQEKIIHGYQLVNAELRQQVRQAGAAGAAHKKHGTDSQSIFAQMGWTLKGSILGPLKTLAAPMGVLYMIRTGYMSWLQVVREVASETRKASGELVSFVALQEAGDKAPRLQQALRLAEQYGVKDRGQAIDTIQAMQSVWGSYEKGMEAAKTIFAATRVGIDVKTGKELEVLGRGKGLAPGEALRMAYIGGELSGLTPKDIATIAPALSFHDNPALAFSIATALSTTTPAGELDTYTKAAGRGLMSTGKLGKWYEAHGVGEGATQFDRLRALHEAGIDTAEEFDKLGLREIRQQKALVDAVQNMDVIENAYLEIKQKAKPGLFLEEMAANEAEVPMLRYSRQADRLQAMAANELLNDPDEAAADLRHRKMGLAMRRVGGGSTVFGGSIDEEGRMTEGGLFKEMLSAVLTKGALPFLINTLRLAWETHAVNKEVEDTDILKDMSESLKSIDEKMAPGPGRKPLSKPTKDK